MKLKRKFAVAILTGLGFNTADRMTDDRLTIKFSAAPQSIPDLVP